MRPKGGLERPRVGGGRPRLLVRWEPWEGLELRDTPQEGTCPRQVSGLESSGQEVLVARSGGWRRGW